MYRLGGFEALKDKPRRDKGIRAIPEELIKKACALKLEVPERSIERIITIMENMQLAPPGLLRRSTLHRALQARGLSARKLVIPDNQDLDRWQADYANDLWQADMLQGPWLPDPNRKGKMRRSYLYAFLDDASRLLLYGRFFFKGDLPALELVFKRSLQRYGNLRGFTIDDARQYIRYHLDRVEGPQELLADSAIQMIFHLAKGIPRVINQLALQGIIRAAVQGIDTIDENFLKQHVLNNSIFDNKLGES